MDNLNDIFGRVESRAEKWVEAGKKKGPCDKRKIEELLKERYEYLKLSPRKLVWCSSVAELKEKIVGQSADDLLPKDEREWLRFMKLLENQLRRQLKSPAKRRYPSRPLYETFNSLNGELLHNWLAKLFVKNDYKFRKDLQKALSDKLWNLFTSQEKSIWYFSRINRFWEETMRVNDGAYYDCLWFCLPDNKKFKNYFAYFYELYGEGIAFLLPAKGAEFLLSSPERAFEDIVQEAVTEKSKAFGESPELKAELDTVMEGLVLFENRLAGLQLSEEVLRKAQAVIQILKRNILALRKDFPSSSLCYEVGRIAKSYLPGLLDSYANLSEASRSKKLKIMLLSLEILEDELLNISESIENRRVQDFEVMAQFLKEKFEPSSLGI